MQDSHAHLFPVAHVVLCIARAHTAGKSPDLSLTPVALSVVSCVMLCHAVLSKTVCCVRLNPQLHLSVANKVKQAQAAAVS